MTNAPLADAPGPPITGLQDSLSVADNPGPMLDLEALARSFIREFEGTAREPARVRHRRMARILDPGAGDLPAAHVELLRDVATVAAIAVEMRLRAFLAMSGRASPEAAFSPQVYGIERAGANELPMVNA